MDLSQMDSRLKRIAGIGIDGNSPLLLSERMANATAFILITHMIQALSKYRISTRESAAILFFVAVYSFLPLILDFKSYPPGDDPIRLDAIANGWTHYYYGFLPIKVTGVALYFYSSFLIMFLGLWVFFRSRDHALFAWIILLFLIPTIYLNMVAGAWINVINFFGLVLITIRFFTDWLDGRGVKYFFLAASLSFITPLAHNETGGYLAAGLATYFLVRNPRKLYAIIPIMIAMYLVMFQFGARGAALLDLDNPNRDETVVFTNPITGEIERIYKTRLELERAKEAGEIRVRAGDGEKSFLLPVTDVGVLDINVAYWTTNFVTFNLIIPIIIVTSLSTLMWGRGVLKKIPENLFMLAAAIPAMAFLAFSPWAISPYRIGVHLVSIVAILTGYFVVENWRSFNRAEVRWIFVAVFGYLILINLPNSLAVWITTRA